MLDDKKKRRKEQVAILKKRLGNIPESLKERVRTNKKIKKEIMDALKGSEIDENKALTIPEIVELTGLSADIVNWHLASLRKYGKAKEINKRKGPYFKWVLIQNTK